MIKTIIIDDEKHVRDEIRSYLETSFASVIHILAEATSVKEAITVIEEQRPDLIFLDINLGNGTGFDVIATSKYKEFDVVFITAYDKHAIKAIKVGALDYLLKPIDDEEFIEVVKKVIKQQTSKQTLKQLFKVAENHFLNTDTNKIVLKTMDSIYTITLDDIIYCSSEGHYTTFFIKNTKPLVITKSMKKTEELLPSNIFIRCHQSYLVNKHYVQNYHKQGVFTLTTGDRVPVSGRKKDFVLQQVFNI